VLLFYRLTFDILMVYNLIFHCKMQLDWGTWSKWLAYFKANIASNENPLTLTGDTLADETAATIELNNYIEAPAKFEQVEQTKAEWFHELLVNMDPHGRVLLDESESLPMPVVGATASQSIYAYIPPVNGWRLASQIMVLIEEAVKVVYFFGSNYYYYNLSNSFFKLCTTLFVMVDHVARIGIIIPTPSWNRYRTNA